MNEYVLCGILIAHLIYSYFKDAKHIRQIDELTSKIMSRDFDSYMYASKKEYPKAPEEKKIKFELPEEEDFGTINSYIV